MFAYPASSCIFLKPIVANKAESLPTPGQVEELAAAPVTLIYHLSRWHPTPWPTLISIRQIIYVI